MIHKIPKTNYSIEIGRTGYLSIPFVIDIGYSFQPWIKVKVLFWYLEINELPF